MVSLKGTAGNKNAGLWGVPNSSTSETHAHWLCFHVVTADPPQEFSPVFLLMFIHQTLILFPRETLRTEALQEDRF